MVPVITLFIFSPLDRKSLQRQVYNIQCVCAGVCVCVCVRRENSYKIGTYKFKIIKRKDMTASLEAR